jgi:hypothetical protein
MRNRRIMGMNPETHRFEELPERVTKNDPREKWTRFEIGETVIIKGIKFIVKKIEPTSMILRLED